jgi:hypothetical protein
MVSLSLNYKGGGAILPIRVSAILLILFNNPTLVKPLKIVLD